VKLYDEFGKLAGIAATLIVAGIILYNFAIYVLPWLALAAVVIAAIIFYFWQRTTRRSEHPWD
jgi:cytochrome oxidase assembly protein ShyY1